MVKEAFQRLSPERQEELLYKGMMLYLKNPYRSGDGADAGGGYGDQHGDVLPLL